MSGNLYTDCVSCLCSVLQTPAERSRVSNKEQQDQQVGDVDCFIIQTFSLLLICIFHVGIITQREESYKCSHMKTLLYLHADKKHHE